MQQLAVLLESEFNITVVGIVALYAKRQIHDIVLTGGRSVAVIFPDWNKITAEDDEIENEINPTGGPAIPNLRLTGRNRGLPAEARKETFMTTSEKEFFPETVFPEPGRKTATREERLRIIKEMEKLHASTMKPINAATLITDIRREEGNRHAKIRKVH